MVEKETKTSPPARSTRATGTRDRVVAWLDAHGDVDDPAGMASASLADSVGYPGTSVAFAQLLSGMERSGLIRREIRGKRTYRVALTEDGRARSRQGPVKPRTAFGSRRRSDNARRLDRGADGSGQITSAVDYDELARRLLRQVAYRLAGEGGARSLVDPVPEGQVDALEERVSALEAELLHARAARVVLEEENQDLRHQLERIHQSLGLEGRHLARPRVPAPVDPIDHREVALLRKLLVERGDPGGAGRADSA